MEADEYFTTYDALHEDGHAPGHLNVRVKESCGIHKVVWSSFDFMTGPELKFVWEVGTPNSMSPVDLSGEEGSVNDAESLDSSISTRSVMYEDIDDPLMADLTLPTEMMESMLMDESAYGMFDSSNFGEYGLQRLQYLDDYMTESRSTTTATMTTLADGSQQNLHESMLSSSKSLDRSTDLLTTPTTSSSKRGSSSGETTAASPVGDMMCGTPMESLDLSGLLSAEPQQVHVSFTCEDDDDDDRNRLDSNTTESSEHTVIRTDSAASFAQVIEDDEMRKNSKQLIEEGGNNGLTSSCVDSGIGGTISTHSDMSALCMSPNSPKRTVEDEVRVALSRLTMPSRESSTASLEEMTNLLDVPLDAPDDVVSEESFVSKFVLAEQICSTQLPSNPLMHKMTLVPARRLLVGSFIFSADAKDGTKTIHAISFLLSNKRTEWYMERLNFLEGIITDAVPRMKASLLTEEWDDVIVRATTELTKLMSLQGMVDRYALVNPTRPLMIKNTLFAEKKCHDNKLLSRSISGVLQSQGYCVIIGADYQLVNKLLHTLALFIPEEARWCCLRAYRHKYSPYIRLQAVRRIELPHVIQYGSVSPWPLCIIDLDRSTVCMSAPYSRHRVLRSRIELASIRAVANQHSPSKDKPIKLELSNCRTMECVKTLISRMDLLPMEESARIGFINQFLLYVENMAYALIAYIKDASMPLPSEKESATKSSRFSLSECRKSLDLQSDGWFHAVLARAQLIQPELAEFIYAS